MMSFEKVFVTVGTTKFDELVAAVIHKDTIKVFKRKQCRHLLIQIGAGEIEPNLIDDQITLTFYRFKNSILEDIRASDLVISHAGAGTCLDVLENCKPLVTVINDKLMHNHQCELAEKLSEDGYSLCCSCDSLAATIQILDPSTLTPFKNENDEKSALLIEKYIFSGKIS